MGGEELNANHMVTQIVECIEGGYAKDKRLLTLLEKYHKSRTNRCVSFLSFYLFCFLLLFLHFFLSFFLSFFETSRILLV